jgi:hypothetical protein
MTGKGERTGVGGILLEHFSVEVCPLCRPELLEMVFGTLFSTLQGFGIAQLFGSVQEVNHRKHGDGVGDILPRSEEINAVRFEFFEHRNQRTQGSWVSYEDADLGESFLEASLHDQLLL